MSEEQSSNVIESVEATPVETNVEQTQESVEPVVEPKVPTKEELFSSKFANLTRKERELQAKEKEVKAQYTQIEKLNQLKSDKTKMVEALELVGLTLDDVIDYSLKNLEQEAEEQDDSLEGKYKKLEKKLSSIEQKELDAIKAKQEEEEKREQGDIDKTILEFKDKLNAFIEEKSDVYELIAAQSAQDTVFEVIEQHYAENNEVLSYEEAANLVEKYLEDEAKMILSKSKKLQAMLQSKDSDVKESEAVKDSPVKQPEKKVVAPTLAEKMVSPVSVKPKSEHVSREEALKRVAQMLKFN